MDLQHLHSSLLLNLNNYLLLGKSSYDLDLFPFT